MRSCICTVIKNEELYLDEWINYHLNLGIDHIFIFEDIDSNSHKDITAKYDNVSLNSVNIVLDKNSQDEAKELKLTKQYNPQHLYFRNILNFISKNYSSDYDWCFIIDADEFVTIENASDTITSVLSLYSNYDAIILKWKCYGANNHIEKPDYSKNGVVETYTNEMKGIIPDKAGSYMKTCYNLKKYKEDFFFNQHHPNNICNWINSGLEKNMFTMCYKNIFIRHYITKSWEEYANKIMHRGFAWGGKRNYDFFFSVNPEMKHMKDELIKSIHEEMLVILPYKQSGSQGSELELALSLWRKNCKFKYHFVVIGEYDKSFEEKFHWVEFIECPTKPKINGQYNPHLDMINKFIVVSNKYKNKYGGFIWMVDDNYAIKPFSLDDIKTIHYHSITFVGNEKQPTSYWNHDKWKTRQLLDKENLPHINYTTHYPCYFEFSKLDEIWDKFNMQNESYVLEDIYFNYFEHEQPILDSTIRLGIWDNDIYEKFFNNALLDKKIKFVCNSVNGWSKNLENDLLKLT